MATYDRLERALCAGSSGTRGRVAPIAVMLTVLALLLIGPRQAEAQWVLGSWQQTLDLPEGASIFESAGFGDSIIALGAVAGSPRAWVGTVDPDSGEVLSWHATLPIPQPCYYMDGIAIIGSFLIVPDAGASCVGTLAENGDVLSWSLEAGVGYGSQGWGMAAASHGEFVYALGGSDPNVAYSNVAFSRIDSNGVLAPWQQTTPLPFPVNDPMASVIGGHLYLFGGEGVPPSGDMTHSRDVWRAEIQPNGSIGSWELAGLMLQPRPHSNFLRFAGTIHVVAGGVHSYMTNSVESALESEFGTTSMHVWSASLPEVRNEEGTAVVGRWGFVFGGNTWQYGGGEMRAVYFTALGPTNEPPVADAGPDQTVGAGAGCVAHVELDATGSFDPDGDPLTYQWTSDVGLFSGATPSVDLGPGTYDFNLTVSDSLAASGSDSVQVTVLDVAPPEILNASATPNQLWPPNHRMVPVEIGLETLDACRAPVTCQIGSVSSNEPVDGTGDGDTSPDWSIVDSDSILLRAERSGNGSGRVYSISVTCVDESGNESASTVTVLVPHDRRK